MSTTTASPSTTFRDALERTIADVISPSAIQVDRDGAFAFTNLAPGRYFILARAGPAPEPDTPAKPVARNPAARAKLRSEAEAANAIVELKPCQRVVDYAVKLGG